MLWLLTGPHRKSTLIHSNYYLFRFRFSASSLVQPTRVHVLTLVSYHERSARFQSHETRHTSEHDSPLRTLCGTIPQPSNALRNTKTEGNGVVDEGRGIKPRGASHDFVKAKGRRQWGTLNQG
jgi:hypothetical protein